MTESTTSSTSPTKFMIVKSVSVSDAKLMFKDRKGTISTEIFCQADERPATFRLEVLFGHPALDQVELLVHVINRGVRIHRQLIDVYDEQAELCASSTSYGEVHDATKGEKFSFRSLRFKKKDRDSKSYLNFVYRMVYSELPESERSESLLSPPDMTLRRDLQQLFDAGENTDVTFLVRGEHVKAHKILLSARCPHFDRMFRDRMFFSESRDNEVHILDASPAVFRELIQFLYSGKVPEFSKETYELMVVADKYGIRELRDHCESLLRSNLNARNVVGVFILACQLQCEDLKMEAAAALRQTMHIVKRNPECPNWRQLTKYPVLLLKLLGDSFD